jgi:predicted HAD superfamily phosphohydrolase YqeG
MQGRVPLLLLEAPEAVFDLAPPPAALLVDVEGTLTEFEPSQRSVIDALVRFDEMAERNGVDIQRLHYVTNAKVIEGGSKWDTMPSRLHCDAQKPFFTPPEEFRLYGQRTVVVGDQYFTDGLLAWRFGFSFGLVRSRYPQPTWPRLQLFSGRALSWLFFRVKLLR